MFRNTLLGWSTSQRGLYAKNLRRTLYGDVFTGIVQLASCDTEIIDALQDKIPGPRSTEVAESVQQLFNPMSVRIRLIG